MDIPKKRYRSYSPPRETDTEERKASKKASSLDQYFTRPDIAEMCVDFLLKQLNVSLTYFDHIVEPSYGQGAFLNALRRIDQTIEPKLLYIDIDSNDPAHRGDFLTSNLIPKNKKVLCIGNPPFGVHASLAIKFFNFAAIDCECIAFILPASFQTNQVKGQLNPNFVLAKELDLSYDRNFIYQNRLKKVQSVFQIWIRADKLNELVGQDGGRKRKRRKRTTTKRRPRIVKPTKRKTTTKRRTTKRRKRKTTTKRRTTKQRV